MHGDWLDREGKRSVMGEMDYRKSEWWQLNLRETPKLAKQDKGTSTTVVRGWGREQDTGV